MLSNRLKSAVSRVRMVFFPRVDIDYEALRQQEYEAELWHDKWMNNL